MKPDPFSLLTPFLFLVMFALGAQVHQIFAADSAVRRQALWQALLKALPKEYQQIDVYAENPGLTQVLFRSQGGTLHFSMSTGKVQVLQHAKRINQVNCITCVSGENSDFFVLWYNGKPELQIGAGE